MVHHGTLRALGTEYPNTECLIDNAMFIHSECAKQSRLSDASANRQREKSQSKLNISHSPCCRYSDVLESGILESSVLERHARAEFSRHSPRTHTRRQRAAHTSV